MLSSGDETVQLSGSREEAGRGGLGLMNTGCAMAWEGLVIQCLELLRFRPIRHQGSLGNMTPHEEGQGAGCLTSNVVPCLPCCCLKHTVSSGKKQCP